MERVYDTHNNAVTPSVSWTLQVSVEVLDFYPRSGSAFGGQTLTVYGKNFVEGQERYKENIVKLGHTIGSSINQYCYPLGPAIRLGSIVVAGDE